MPKKLLGSNLFGSCRNFTAHIYKWNTIKYMARGHSVYHYATKADYEPVIADVSSQLALKYVVEEWRFKPDFRVYESPLNVLDFGEFKWPSESELTFLIFPKNIDLPYEYWSHRQSLDPDIPPKKYGFHVARNLDYQCIFFHSSGFHKSEQWGEGLLRGWLSTNSEHPDSLAIFNAFKKSIKKHFEYFKHSGAYVGSEAVKYFEAGGRLTQDLRSPKASDCKRVADAS